MRRKQYPTKRERKLDRLRGCLAFPTVYAIFIIAFVISTQAYARHYGREWTGDSILWVQPLFWVIHLTIIGLALYFRPEFGLGYLISIAIGIVFAVVTSVSFLVGCFVTVGYVGMTGLAGPDGPAPIVLLGTITLQILAVAMLGLIVFWPIIRKWWTEPEDGVLLPEKAWLPIPDITWENDVPEGKGGDESP